MHGARAIAGARVVAVIPAPLDNIIAVESVIAIAGLASSTIQAIAVVLFGAAIAVDAKLASVLVAARRHWTVTILDPTIALAAAVRSFSIDGRLIILPTRRGPLAAVRTAIVIGAIGRGFMSWRILFRISAALSL